MSIHFVISFLLFYSTYSRKRPHAAHSPPLRSPEPVAKKHCSRPTPPASPARPARRAQNPTSNGVTNGHSNGNSNGHNNGDTNGSTNGSTNDEAAASERGRRRRGNAPGSRENSESSEQPRTTRSSARLRSSRKWTFLNTKNPLVQFCKSTETRKEWILFCKF